MKLLLVEDDTGIAQLLVDFLSSEFTVTHFTDPLDALACVKEERFDIFILDLTLPNMDGLELCKLIRLECEHHNIGIIISTARTDINDKLYALENGADDYVPKPYDPRELLARIKILAKHLNLEHHKNLFELDIKTAQVFKEGLNLGFSAAEFEIFLLLYTHKNQILSRSDIANSISNHRMESGVESINVLIGRIRKKIEIDPKKPQYIQTLRGLGYRFYE
jgi:two-component system, OmpR family, response regulator